MDATELLQGCPVVPVVVIDDIDVKKATLTPSTDWLRVRLALACESISSGTSGIDEADNAGKLLADW